MDRSGCRRLRLLSLAVALWVPALSWAGGDGNHRRTTVVVVSLDGMRRDYPDRVPGGAFARLAREGVRAGRLEPPFPASTFPSHVTLATGCFPERHGILNNRFRDAKRGEYDRSPDPSWIQCEPLWVTAEKQGVPSAVLSWAGSYGPWQGTAPTRHDETFTQRSDRESVHRVLEWLRLPASTRPRLILAYLSGPDHGGHRYGPEAPEVTQTVRAEDRILSTLLRGLDSAPDRGHIVLLLVSDHGMARRRAVMNPAGILSRERIANRTLMSGGSANVYLERGQDRRRAIDLLSQVAGLEVLGGDALPADLHYQFPGRTGDLVLVAPVGVELGADMGLNSSGGGVHGYRGTEESMGGIFYGWGAGLRRGSIIEVFRAVDLYSLACRILEIKPSPQAQGQVPVGILGAP